MNDYPFIWLETLGETLVKPKAHLAPGHHAMVALRGIANDEVSIHNITIANVYFEYKSYEVKPGDYTSNKYYCMEIAGRISWVQSVDGGRSLC